MAQAAIPFSIEQLKFLETEFGINPLTDRVHIRDGIARKSDHLWMRSNDGPVYITAKGYWDDVMNYPNKFSFKKPEVRVEYID